MRAQDPANGRESRQHLSTAIGPHRPHHRRQCNTATSSRECHWPTQAPPQKAMQLRATSSRECNWPTQATPTPPCTVAIPTCNQVMLQQKPQQVFSLSSQSLVVILELAGKFHRLGTEKRGISSEAGQLILSVCAS